MLRETIVQYNTAFILVGGAMAVYGIYLYATAGKKEKEKRIKGVLEAIAGVVAVLAGLIIK